MSALPGQTSIFDGSPAPLTTRKPRARRRDPETSHAAARSVTGLNEKRQAVLDLLTVHGPMTDERLAFEYRTRTTECGGMLPVQSSSGLRTRRAELVDLGLVKMVGESHLATGRRARVWGVA